MNIVVYTTRCKYPCCSSARRKYYAKQAGERASNSSTFYRLVADDATKTGRSAEISGTRQLVLVSVGREICTKLARTCASTPRGEHGRCPVGWWLSANPRIDGTVRRCRRRSVWWMRGNKVNNYEAMRAEPRAVSRRWHFGRVAADEPSRAGVLGLSLVG